MTARRSTGLLLAVITVGCAGPTPPYDLVLRGGTVVDGTGAEPRIADVAVEGDRIVAVEAELDGAGALEIDVAGLTVAPGFWDNHAHLVDLEEHPAAENFIRQGITTISASLHSQAQVADQADYRARVRVAPNVLLFAGHSWIREEVLGREDRAPTDSELEAMGDLVRVAMEDGAFGLSTGLEYIPAAYSATDERWRSTSIPTRLTAPIRTSCSRRGRSRAQRKISPHGSRTRKRDGDYRRRWSKSSLARPAATGRASSSVRSRVARN